MQRPLHCGSLSVKDNLLRPAKCVSSLPNIAIVLSRPLLMQIKSRGCAQRHASTMREAVSTAMASPEQNRLLATLGAEVRARIFPHLELVSLPLGEVLYESGDAPSHAYFPIDSIVALQHRLASGASVEISLVGNHGLLGITSCMGGDSAPRQAVVIGEGLAYRLPTQRLKDEFNRHGELLRVLLRYTQSLMTQIAQTVVCNGHHSVDRRLCTWLLFALDRVPGNQLTVTQELIAEMLGVRRETIAEAAHQLRRLGVIEYCRGRLTVRDRRQLEQLSCECYGVVKKEADRLLPDPARTSRSKRVPLLATVASL